MSLPAAYIKSWFTAKTRRWLYGVCVAAVPLLVFAGLLDVKASPLVLGFILALFNVRDAE